MVNHSPNYKTFFWLVAVVLAIFIGRTWLTVMHFSPPRLFEMFDAITILGSILVLMKWHRSLKRSDWIVAVGLGFVVGMGMYFTTLFSMYPFFGAMGDKLSQVLDSWNIHIHCCAWRVDDHASGRANHFSGWQL